MIISRSSTSTTSTGLHEIQEPSNDPETAYTTAEVIAAGMSMRRARRRARTAVALDRARPSWPLQHPMEHMARASGQSASGAPWNRLRPGGLARCNRRTKHPRSRGRAELSRPPVIACARAENRSAAPATHTGVGESFGAVRAPNDRTSTTSSMNLRQNSPPATCGSKPHAGAARIPADHAGTVMPSLLQRTIIPAGPATSFRAEAVDVACFSPAPLDRAYPSPPAVLQTS